MLTVDIDKSGVVNTLKSFAIAIAASVCFGYVPRRHILTKSLSNTFLVALAVYS